MQKRSDDKYEDLDGYEDWEGDANLINSEDWNGLLKLREQKAKSNPDDLYDQERYGGALVLNKKYSEAIDYLTPYYQIYYEDNFGISVIMDALIGLGKTEKDFKWINKPTILRLDQSTIDLCKNILTNKKGYTKLCDLYFLLMNNSDYITFKEQALSDFLREKVNDFTCTGKSNDFLDLRIKVKKN